VWRLRARDEEKDGRSHRVRILGSTAWPVAYMARTGRCWCSGRPRRTWPSWALGCVLAQDGSTLWLFLWWVAWLQGAFGRSKRRGTPAAELRLDLVNILGCRNCSDGLLTGEGDEGQ
jgi:hypothetical protein